MRHPSTRGEGRGNFGARHTPYVRTRLCMLFLVCTSFSSLISGVLRRSSYVHTLYACRAARVYTSSLFSRVASVLLMYIHSILSMLARVYIFSLLISRVRFGARLMYTLSMPVARVYISSLISEVLWHLSYAHIFYVGRAARVYISLLISRVALVLIICTYSLCLNVCTSHPSCLSLV